MELLSVPTLAALAIALFAIYRLCIYPTFVSPLSKIPTAHFTSHLSPFWIYYIRWRNTENVTLHELHKVKGPILRLAPNELSINCYEGGLKTVYGGSFGKTDFYARRFINYEVIPLFAMQPGKDHSTRKRMVSNIYSKSYVLSSPTTVATTKHILYERFLPLFQSSALTGKSMEVLSLGYAYSMDSFMSYQFGLSLGSNFIQDVKKREWYLENFFRRRPYLFWMTEVPRFVSFMEKFAIKVVPDWVHAATHELEDWQLDICDKAEELLSKDVVPSAIDMPVVYAQERAAFKKYDEAKTMECERYSYKKSQPYPRRLELATDMYDHNAAAHETSGDTLTYVYYELSRRPALQAQLRQELLSLPKHIQYPLPEGAEADLPDPKSIEGLPLLDAVLQETLRLWTAVPGGQPRVTPSPSCSLAGYDNIPPGVRVQAASYSLHRNPEVFPDPEEWKPERWLNATPAELVEMRHWFWVWGSGGMMCVGNNIATHTMKFAIAAIYTNFTSEIIDAEGIEQADGFTAGPKGNKLLLKYTHV